MLACLCVHVSRFIIIQSLEPHAGIVNEVSTAYDMALLDILTHTGRHTERGRDMRRERERETKEEVHERN